MMETRRLNASLYTRRPYPWNHVGSWGCLRRLAICQAAPPCGQVGRRSDCATSDAESGIGAGFAIGQTTGIRHACARCGAGSRHGDGTECGTGMARVCDGAAGHSRAQAYVAYATTTYVMGKIRWDGHYVICTQRQLNWLGIDRNHLILGPRPKPRCRTCRRGNPRAWRGTLPIHRPAGQPGAYPRPPPRPWCPRAPQPPCPGTAS